MPTYRLRDPGEGRGTPHLANPLAALARVGAVILNLVNRAAQQTLARNSPAAQVLQTATTIVNAAVFNAGSGAQTPGGSVPPSPQPTAPQPASPLPSTEELREQAHERGEGRQQVLQRRDSRRDAAYSNPPDLSGYDIAFFGDSLPVNRAALFDYAFAQNDWDDSYVRTTWSWYGEVMRRTGAARIEQGFSSLTTELLKTYLGPEALTGMNPREQAHYLNQEIHQMAGDYGLNLGNTRGKTAQEMLQLFIGALEKEQQEIIDLARITGHVTNERGLTTQELVQIRRQWQRVEATLGTSPEVTEDVLEWANYNFGNVDANNARDVEQATRYYLYQQIRGLGLGISTEDLAGMGLRELADLYVREQETSLQARLEIAYQAYRAWLHENAPYQLPLSIEEFPEFTGWQTEAYEGLRRAQKLVDALNNLYSPPPDFNLLILVGTLFIEPLDWVVTGVEIAQDLTEGDWGGAVGNSVLLALPFAAGWMDEALGFGTLAPDHRLGSALPAGALDDAAQAAWRESVSYERKLGLPDTGIVPGQMHPSIRIEDGQAYIGGNPVRSPADFTYPGVYHFENVNDAAIRAKLQTDYPQGVYIEQYGFPDLTPYSEANVRIQRTGSRLSDAQLANEALGLERTLVGYVWHHHQDGMTMMLVPQRLHERVAHTGGYAIGVSD